MSAVAGLVIDPGLLARFRAAGRSIQWRDARPPRPSYGSRRSASLAFRPSRVAHLNDEEALIEESREGNDQVVMADSGPVGALVLLLEIDRRGPPAVLEAVEADESPHFASGALRCRWSKRTSPAPKRSVPVSDLVGLARYALR